MKTLLRLSEGLSTSNSLYHTVPRYYKQCIYNKIFLQLEAVDYRLFARTHKSSPILYNIVVPWRISGPELLQALRSPRAFNVNLKT